MKKRISEQYFVVSKDGKWFFTGKFCFSDNEKHAIPLSIEDAKKLISDITTMELEMRKAA